MAEQFFFTEKARKWLRLKICMEFEKWIEIFRCQTCNVAEMKWGSRKCTMFATLGHGTHHVGHERQETSAESPILKPWPEVTSWNAYFWHIVVSLREWDARMSWFVVNMQQKVGRIVPVNVWWFDGSQWDCALNKLWNGFKHFVSGHMTMCDCHGHLYNFLGNLGGRTIFFYRKGPKMATT